MNRNILAALCIALIIIVSVTATFLRTPAEIDSLLATLRTQIYHEQWPQAAKTVADLTRRWERMNAYLFFTVGLDDIQRFGERLAEVKARVTTEDKKAALASTAALERIWDSFGAWSG